jgi:hypothetical protein
MAVVKHLYLVPAYETRFVSHADGRMEIECLEGKEQEAIAFCIRQLNEHLAHNITSLQEHRDVPPPPKPPTTLSEMRAKMGVPDPDTARVVTETTSSS